MATFYPSFQEAHVPSHGVATGGSNGRHTANSGEDECFNIELDDPPDSRGSQGLNHSQTLNQVFELLNSGLPDSGVEALSVVEANISDPSWRQQFLALDGASLCVELMGCFSGVEVQHASAQVCAALASTGQEACMALIQADVGSMLQQHIKSSETTLRMFEDAALIISALANNAGEIGHKLTALGLMAHLCGMLSNPADDARPARIASLAAITSLCANQRQSQLNFFQYGGLNTVLQTFLQTEHDGAEMLATMKLVERVLAPMHECRDLIENIRGIEVLTQVHREAESRGQTALCDATVRALAQLTYQHPRNLEALESDTRFLRHESLYCEVVALHQKIVASPRLFLKRPPFSSNSPPNLPSVLVSGEDSGSDPDSPPFSGGRSIPMPWNRKSLDGSGRTLRRMSSSMKMMFGNVRKLMRSERSDDGALEGGTLSGGTGGLYASTTQDSNDGGVGVCHTARF